MVTNRREIDFICRKCEGCHENVEGQEEKLHVDVKTVTDLGDGINSGGCVAVVSSRTGLGWVKFIDCQDLLSGKEFPLKIKGNAYKSCVRSAMLYESKTWCLDQNEAGILQRTERAMVRNMCGVKLMDKKSTKDLMQMLDLNETMDQLVKANSVRWYGHVLKKDKNNFLRMALDLRVKGTKKIGRPKKTWLRAVVERSRNVGLNVIDANNRSRWRLGVNSIYSKLI